MGERSQSSDLLRRQYDSSLDWVAVLLALALAGIHFYLGLTVNRSPFLVVGAGFLAGVVFFLTRYWRPVLYLVGATYALVLGFMWILNGMRYETIGIVTGAISTAFLLLVFYLFVREGSLVERTSERT